MAQLSAHGGLRMAFGADLGDPFQCWISGGGCYDRISLLESPVGFYRRSMSGGWSGRVSSATRKTETRNVEKREGTLKDVDADVDGDKYEEEFERDELSCCRGLILDISYRPVNVVCWKRAICLEFMEKVKMLFERKIDIVQQADVLEYYDQTVSSPRGSFYIPAVLRVPHLLQVMKRRRIKCTLSRKSVFYRDNYTCQYCSSRENLTIDHILPISHGGEWKWENLVAACAKCNSRKGQKTVEEANMNLIKIPKAPKDYDILAIPLTNAAMRSLKMRKGVPEEWLQYLSQPSP